MEIKIMKIGENSLLEISGCNVARIKPVNVTSLNLILWLMICSVPEERVSDCKLRVYVESIFVL